MPPRSTPMLCLPPPRDKSATGAQPASTLTESETGTPNTHNTCKLPQANPCATQVLTSNFRPNSHPSGDPRVSNISRTFAQRLCSPNSTSKFHTPHPHQCMTALRHPTKTNSSYYSCASNRCDQPRKARRRIGDRGLHAAWRGSPLS